MFSKRHTKILNGYLKWQKPRNCSPRVATATVRERLKMAHRFEPRYCFEGNEVERQTALELSNCNDYKNFVGPI